MMKPANLHWHGSPYAPDHGAIRTAATRRWAGGAGPERVSSDRDRLVLVDEEDKPIGDGHKLACHLGGGRLHRAFSLFLFNPQGDVLLQKRADSKHLWPGYWSNSCCSHPRPREALVAAARRRAHEELGLHVEPRFLYKFHYTARYQDVGTENEICSVFAATSDTEPAPNPNEISAYRYFSPKALDESITRYDGQFTPWFLMEWQRIRQDFPHLPGA